MYFIVECSVFLCSGCNTRSSLLELRNWRQEVHDALACIGSNEAISRYISLTALHDAHYAIPCPVWQLHTPEVFGSNHIPAPATVNCGYPILMRLWWHVVIIELMKSARFQVSAAVCLSPFPIWDFTHRRLFTYISGQPKGPLNSGANRLYRNVGSQIPTYTYQHVFF